MVKYLLSKGFQVAVYDDDENTFKTPTPNLYRLSSIRDLIANCDLIFGCTGRDITANVDILPYVISDKYLISCTSEDKEFRSLLQHIAKQINIQVDTLADIQYRKENGATLTIVQGGFPLNFKGGLPWNVPAQDIAVTQAALFGACIQAICIAKPTVNDGKTINCASRHCLDPFIQRFLVIQWLINQHPDRYPEKVKVCFNGPEWITKNSGGTYHRNDNIMWCFTAQINSLAFDDPPNSKL